MTAKVLFRTNPNAFSLYKKEKTLKDSIFLISKSILESKKYHPNLGMLLSLKHVLA